MKFLKRILTLFYFSGLFTAHFAYADSSNPVSAQDTVRLLTIGNSFADNACRYLKEITESVEGYHIIIGNANIGGAPLDRHAENIQKSEEDPSFKPYGGKSLKDWLLEEQWDVVTIQQVSHKSFIPGSHQPYADEIVAFVKKYAPDSKIYIHQTWAYAPDCNRLEELGTTYEQMYTGLKGNYEKLAGHFGAGILKSGDAFYRAYNSSKIDLWNPNDRFHANSNGSYLAGCVWFSELFHISAKEIQFVPEGMSNQTAGFLRASASD